MHSKQTNILISCTVPCHICYWNQSQKSEGDRENRYMQNAVHQESTCSQKLHRVLVLQSEIHQYTK